MEHVLSWTGLRVVNPIGKGRAIATAAAEIVRARIPSPGRYRQLSERLGRDAGLPKQSHGPTPDWRDPLQIEMRRLR